DAGDRHSDTWDNVGQREVDLLNSTGLQPHHFLVDIGCGCGRLAHALGDYLAEAGKYLGFDIVEETLEVGRSVSDPSYEFRLIPDFTIDVPDNTADFVMFASVLTHLIDYECYRYLLEAKRIIKLDGKIVVSFARWDSAYWWEFESLVQHGADPTLAIYINMMTHEMLKAWAKHLELNVSFMGPEHIGQDVAIFTHP
ncbi:MAG TPA: methyltransferase domain-containing protein, partial [bacterium]|nr:methyltransferase domain-containing protein [bacterium]